ncbi:uncharacterized protein TNCV_2106051 [Trichonephila clavipes]|nr:uncharacterized protein TNCV_2106051 [Trichonephila clavipes]
MVLLALKSFTLYIKAVGGLVVRASDSRSEGLGSMLDVTKYPPSAHGFTCRNCGGGDRCRVAIYRPFGEVSLSLNRTVTCMVLMANDRRTSCPCHDEFRGPRSDYVREVALATTTTTSNSLIVTAAMISVLDIMSGFVELYGLPGYRVPSFRDSAALLNKNRNGGRFFI